MSHLPSRNMCAGAHHPTQVVFDDGGDTARSNCPQVALASGIVAHAAVYNGAVTRGSAQSSSTGRHNRRLHGALLLNCAYPSGTVAVSERECSRLIGFDRAHGNMSKRDGGDRAKRVSRTTSAPASCIGLLTLYWRQLSVGNCFALDGPNVASDSKQTPKN